jgi:hypothetical protein
LSVRHGFRTIVAIAQRFQLKFARKSFRCVLDQPPATFLLMIHWHHSLMLSTNKAPTRATARSKISNGTRLFTNIDGRTSSARRFRDLVQSFEAEFEGNLCEADRSLIRQAATLLLKSEQMQEAVVRGEPVDSDALIRMASTAKRVLAAISAKSVKRKPAAPTIADYLARKAAEKAASAAEDDAA